MKKIILILALVFTTGILSAQSPVLFQDPLTKMYGYKGLGGKVVIPAVFVAGIPFQSEMTIVREPVGGLGIPLSPGGSPVGQDYHIPEAQKVLLGGLFGVTGPDTLTVKHPESIPSQFNRIRFDYIQPHKRISEVKPSGLSVEKEEGHQAPVVTHKKSGLNYMHPYSIFDREEHESLIANTAYFRLRMPFTFESTKSETPYGFGLEYQFWLTHSGGECKEYHHLAFIVKSDLSLDVFSRRAPYEDAKVCGGWNCWNGKKKLDYQDLKNYTNAGSFPKADNGLYTLEVIRNKEDFYIYINETLMFSAKIPNCSYGYGDFPIPLFLNKGAFRFYPGSEYSIYIKSSR